MLYISIPKSALEDILISIRNSSNNSSVIKWVVFKICDWLEGGTASPTLLEVWESSRPSNQHFLNDLLILELHLVCMPHLVEGPKSKFLLSEYCCFYLRVNISDKVFVGCPKGDSILYSYLLVFSVRNILASGGIWFEACFHCNMPPGTWL